MLRICVFGFMFMIASSGVRAQEKKELPEKLQPFLGKWNLVKIEGKEVPTNGYKHVHTITADLWSIQEANLKPDVYDCKFDTTKTPHTFEMVSQRVQNRVKGIMKIEKDKLTICFGESDKEYPAEFKAVAGKWIVASLERWKEGATAIVKEKPEGPITLKHTGFIYGVAFAPDGKTLAAGSYAVVKRWDVSTWKELASLDGHTQPVETIAFSPNGKQMVSASGFGGQDVKLWDMETSKVAFALNHGAGYAAFSPDNKTVATGASDQKVKLWDTTSGELRATLDINADFVMAMTFSPDGKVLAIGNRDKTIRLWDPLTEKKIATLEGHTGFLCKLVYSPNGKFLASGSWDGTVKLWDTTTQREFKTLTLEKGIVKGVAFSLDGKLLATGSGEGVVKFWDTKTWKEVGTLPRQPSLMSIAFSPDSKLIATGIGLSPRSGEVKIWDVTAYVKSVIKVQPVVTDYREIHNAELPELKKWFASLPQKYRPVHLTHQEGSSGKRFDAIAIEDGASMVFQSNLGLSSLKEENPTLDQDDKAMHSKGMKRNLVVAYFDDKVYRRHQIWTKDTQYMSTWNVRPELDKTLAKFRTDGLFPMGMIQYDDRLALNGGPDEGRAWEFHLDLSAEQVKQKLDECQKRDWKPTMIHRHRFDANKFAMVLVENPTKVVWEYQSGLSLTEYEKRIVELKLNGSRPQYVQSCIVDKAPVYSVLWVGGLKSTTPKK